MTNYDPIDLLYGGMEKLGPGDNTETLRVLALLPSQTFRLVVDAGCGTGRQTLALAKALGTPIQAVDVYEPFLKDLMRRAREAGLEHLIQPHCMDMQDLTQKFQNIDLIWSEGAAYNIGFANALSSWASLLTPNGLLVASELSWLREQVPTPVKIFFQAAYPEMQSVQRNIEIAESAGYKVLTTHKLPRKHWINGYYDILGLRAQALVDHTDAAVRDLAAETLAEIDMFEISEDSYGYVFYILQRC
ncbi:SAM-dependent methyltransferase [Pseudomonadota bacterium]